MATRGFGSQRGRGGRASAVGSTTSSTRRPRAARRPRPLEPRGHSWRKCSSSRWRRRYGRKRPRDEDDTSATDATSGDEKMDPWLSPFEAPESLAESGGE